MVIPDDPFNRLYAENHGHDHATVQTREGTAILCWLDDSGVLHLAKTIEKEGGRDETDRT